MVIFINLLLWDNKGQKQRRILTKEFILKLILIIEFGILLKTEFLCERPNIRDGKNGKISFISIRCLFRIMMKQC